LSKYGGQESAGWSLFIFFQDMEDLAVSMYTCVCNAGRECINWYCQSLCVYNHV